MTLEQAKEKVISYVDFIFYTDNHPDYFIICGCKNYRIKNFRIYKNNGQVIEFEN